MAAVGEQLISGNWSHPGSPRDAPWSIQVSHLSDDMIPMLPLTMLPLTRVTTRDHHSHLKYLICIALSGSKARLKP